MSHFWSAFANQLRDCGRGAAWFLVALGGFFILMVMGALAVDHGHVNEVIGVAAVGGVVMLCQLAAAIRRAVQWRRHRLKLSKLSDDELTKARAKLARRSKSAGPLPPLPVKARPFCGPIY